jgi:murein DD-endopeptidase MepM/ murein hydrolase activator NlpD
VRLTLILTTTAVFFALAPAAPVAAHPGHTGAGWFSATTVGMQQPAELVARLRATQKAKLAAVAHVLTTPPPAPPPAPAVTEPTSFIWPAKGPITSPFGRRWGRAHTGVDIDAATGSPIVAAQAGTVTLAGWKNGYGNTVIIDHGHGISTLYAHQSRLGVHTGQHVDQGQYLGNVGATGNVTAAHLHYEVLLGGVPRNPMPWL